ncbi:hypothetical protein [Sphingosinicella sp. BN140058]|uniref:hypothetical protein n=1 Tax=Sphingosinicella sp. BN140058 TaxID=1892855 RepID=UPI001011C698|nr:hypothetical protein [Sphingosinicella sp. BN140058]QAY77927.1 hypothetical protein ETR14_16405 [Sphingosinicella sp. BN140058]
MIELPYEAVPNGATPAYLDFGGFLTPGLGGRVQRIDRMGNRFRVAFTFPPMEADGLGRIVVSRLIRAKTEGIRIELPQLGFKLGAPGAPRVNGGGQAGKTLVVDGLTPRYPVREGQWFNHVRGADVMLYNVTAGVAADASGQATLAISPMLRVEPLDNDVINFARPVIQGYVHGEDWQWQMSLAHHLGIAFEVEEYV